MTPGRRYDAIMQNKRMQAYKESMSLQEVEKLLQEENDELSLYRDTPVDDDGFTTVTAAPKPVPLNEHVSVVGYNASKAAKYDDDDLILVVVATDEDTYDSYAVGSKNKYAALLHDDVLEFTPLRHYEEPMYEISPATGPLQFRPLHLKDETEDIEVYFGDFDPTAPAPETAPPAPTKRPPQANTRKREKRVVYDPLEDMPELEHTYLSSAQYALVERQAVQRSRIDNANRKEARKAAKKNAQTADQRVDVFLDSMSRKVGVTGAHIKCGSEFVSLAELFKDRAHEGFPNKVILAHVDCVLHVDKPGKPGSEYFSNLTTDDNAGKLLDAFVNIAPCNAFRFNWLKEARFKPNSQLNHVIAPHPRPIVFSTTTIATMTFKEETVMLELPRQQEEFQKLVDAGYKYLKTVVPKEAIEWKALCARLQELFPDETFPHWDEVIKHQTIARSALQLISEFRITHVADIFMFVGVCVHRIVENARSSWVKFGVSKAEYQPIYNKAFGKIYHSKHVQELITLARQRGESDDRIKAEIVAPLAAEAATARTTGLYTHMRRSARSRTRNAVRLTKLLAFTEDDPERALMPVGEEEFSVLSVIGSLYRSAVDTLRDKYADVCEALSSYQLLWQTRISSIASLLISLGRKDTFSIISNLVTLGVSFFKVDEVPDCIRRVVRYVLGDQPIDTTPTHTCTSGRAYRLVGDEKEYSAFVNAILREQGSIVASVDDYDACELLRIPRTHKFNNGTYTLFRSAFETNFQPVSESALLSFSDFLQLPDFYEIMARLFGFGEMINANTLKNLGNICNSFNSITRTATTVLAAFKWIVSTVFVWLFDYDPFDPLRTKWMQLAWRMSEWLRTTKYEAEPTRVHHIIRKYSIIGSFLLNDFGGKIPVHVHQAVSKAYAEFKPQYDSAKKFVEEAHPRQQPFSVLWVGPGGVGKTAANANFVRIFMPLINKDDKGDLIPYNENHTYQMPSTSSRYFDGVDGQIHMNCDDFMSVKNPEAMQWLMDEWLRIASTSRYVLNTAFADKGKRTADWKFITMCTNLENPSRDLVPNYDPVAVGRRFQLYIKIDQDPNHQFQAPGARPFLDQRFIVSGPYIRSFAAAHRLEVYEDNVGIWEQLRPVNHMARLYLLLNGAQLVECALHSYERLVNACKDARLPQSDVEETISRLKDLYAAPGAKRPNMDAVKEQIEGVRRLAASFDAEPEVEAKPLARPAAKEPEVAQTGPHEYKRSFDDRDFNEACKDFEVVTYDQPRLYDTIKKSVKEHPYALLASAIFIGGAAAWFMFFKSADEQSQSPNYNHGKSHDADAVKGAPKNKKRVVTFAKEKAQLNDADPNKVREVAWSRAVAEMTLYLERNGVYNAMHQVKGWFISPNCLLIPGHYAAVGDIASMDVTDVMKTYKGITDFSVTDFPEYDLAVIHLPSRGSLGLTPHCSLKNSFVRAIDQHGTPWPTSRFRQAAMRYILYDLEKRVVHAESIYVADVADSIYEGPDGKSIRVASTLRFRRAYAGGACGTMYSTIQNGTPYICGFHISGNSTVGGAIHINDKLIAMLLKEAESEPSPPEPPNFAEPEGDDGSGVHSVPPAVHAGEQEEALTPNFQEMLDECRWHVKGDREFYDCPVAGIITKESKQRTTLMRGTKYSATPFLGCTPVEPDCAPINMFPHVNAEGVKVDPVQKVLLKKTRPRIPMDKLPYYDDYLSWFKSWMPRNNHRVLSLHEALNGVDTLPPIATSTSVGWPEKCGGKSQKIFHTHRTVDGKLQLNEDLEKRFNFCLSQAKQRIRYRMAYLDTLKDETLPRTDKVRLFGAGPIIHVLLQRMYFGTFFDAFNFNPTQTPSSIGINVHCPHQWKSLLDRLVKPEVEIGSKPRGYSNDAVSYDASLQLELLQETWYTIIDLMDFVGEDLAAAEVIAWNSIQNPTVFEAILYYVIRNPSGHSGTGPINTICNARMVYTAWRMLCAKYNVTPDVRKLAMALYGDDNTQVDGTRLEDGDRLPWHEAVDIFKNVFGVELTDSDKYSGLSAFIAKEVLTLSYLSRSWVYDPTLKLWNAPLPLPRLASMISYMKNWDETPNVQSTINSLALELSHHGESTYREWQKAVTDHPWFKEQHLHMMSFSDAMALRIGVKVHHLQTDELNQPELALLALPIALPTQQTRQSCTSGDEFMNKTLSTVETQNLVTFVGDPATQEVAPVNMLRSVGAVGPKNTFPGYDDRPVLLSEVTVTPAMGVGTQLASLRFPEDILGQKPYNGLIKSSWYSYKEICFWIVVTSGPFSYAQYEITGGSMQAVQGLTQGYSKEQHFQHLFDSSMSQETCIKIPWDGPYPIAYITSPADITPDNANWSSQYYVTVLNPLTSSFNGVSPTATLSFYASIKGLTQHFFDPWTGTLGAEKPRKKVVGKALPTSETYSWDENDDDERALMATPVRVSAKELREMFSGEERVVDRGGAPNGDASHGVIEKMAENVAKVMIDVGATAGKLQTAAELVASASAAFALGNPTDNSPAEKVTLTTTPADLVTFPGHDLTMYKGHEVPERLLGNGNDAFDFIDIASKPSPAGMNLPLEVGKEFLIPVTPNLVTTCNPEAASSTPLWCGVPGMFTAYWHGSMKYLVQLVLPNGTYVLEWRIYQNFSASTIAFANQTGSGINRTDVGNVILKRVTLQGTSKQLIEVPWISHYPAGKNDFMGINSFGYGNIPDMDEAWTPCVLGLTLKNLTVTTGAPITEVPMNMWISAGPDMRWFQFVDRFYPTEGSSVPTFQAKMPIVQSFATYARQPYTPWASVGTAPSKKTRPVVTTAKPPEDKERALIVPAVEIKVKGETVHPSLTPAGMAPIIGEMEEVKSIWEILHMPVPVMDAYVLTPTATPQPDPSEWFRIVPSVANGVTIYGVATFTSTTRWLTRYYITNMYARYSGSMNVGIIPLGDATIIVEKLSQLGGAQTEFHALAPVIVHHTRTNPETWVRLPSNPVEPYQLVASPTAMQGLKIYTSNGYLRTRIFTSFADDFRLGLLTYPDPVKVDPTKH